MENTSYTTLSRQSGLMQEMQSVANNIANAATTGYRKEGIIFSEYVKDVGNNDPSLSMARASIRNLDESQGALASTGGTFDFAIEGDGYFLVETPTGPNLTRAGTFTPNEQGDLVTFDGYPVLDSGGAPIFIPTDVGKISVASDGTISAEGAAISQIGVFLPEDTNNVSRTGSTLFDPGGEVIGVDIPVVVQGFVEKSNVNPITEIARMIEVQRAYEFGQSFLEKEDERLRGLMQTLGK